MHRLFGTDGVRGIANEALSCERATQIGRALGTVLSSRHKYRPKVLIGMDTRLSSPMLASAIAAGLCSAGSDVIGLGVVPTPAVAYLVGKYQAKAGVMISASHNPFPYNGIKIFGDTGYKLSDELEELISRLREEEEDGIRRMVLTCAIKGSPFTNSGHYLLMCGLDDEYMYFLDPLRRDNYDAYDKKGYAEILQPGVCRIKLENLHRCDLTAYYLLEKVQ